MTALEILEEVFTQKYPSGTFAFNSEIRGDKNERYRDKEVTTPLCLIVADITDDFSAENGQFEDRLNFRMLLLESNTDHWKTYSEKENNIVAPLRIAAQEIITKVIYQYPDSVTTDTPFQAQGTSIYDWGSGNHSGIGYRFSVNQLNELNICSDPITYTVDLQSGDDGTTVPEPDIYTYDKGEIVAYYAEADAGYKFSEWLVNNASNTDNPLGLEIDRNYTVIAQFIVSIIKQLTIAVSGNGTTSPTPGAYEYESGSLVPITAIENDDNYVFDEFTVNGTPDSNNPIIVEVIDNTNVVAYFIEWYQRLLFSGENKITTIDSLHYFINQTSIGNLALFQIKNTQVATFDGIGDVVTVSIPEFNNTSINSFKVIWKGVPEDLSNINFLFSKDLEIIESHINTNGTIRFIPTEDVFLDTNIALTGDYVELEYYYNVSLAQAYVKINGIDAILTNGGIGSIGDPINTSNSVFRLAKRSLGSLLSKNKTTQWCLEIDEVAVLNWTFQSGKGTKIVDISGNGNDGTYSGGIEADFWANRSEYAYPYLIKYGYDKYENNTNPGEYKYVIYDINGDPTELSVEGYTKILSVPPNSGISDNDNTYMQPANNNELYTLSQAYSELNIFYTDLANPNDVTYSQLKAIDKTGIPSNRFDIDNENEFITEMKSADIT